MTPGLYQAASAMVTSLERHEVIANNLANASTPGFKRDVTTVVPFADTLGSVAPQQTWPWASPGYLGGATTADFRPGPLKPTGRDLDLAIVGEGFFVVETPAGTRYTRNGALSLNADGELVTGDGAEYHVQGEGGAITVPLEAVKIGIDPSGGVSADGAMVGRLRLVDFEKPYALEKVGGGLFAPAEEDQDEIDATEYRVAQGHLEMSNVNVIAEMIDLIVTSRNFEMAQRMIQAQDATLSKSVNEVGSMV